jgi:hypothetical protein
MHGTIPAMERVYTTPLLDKLGLRPGMRVALIDIDDPDIRPLIAERTLASDCRLSGIRETEQGPTQLVALCLLFDHSLRVHEGSSLLEM